MFTPPQPVVYPDDPNQVFWDYSQGSELEDLPALANYYARLASWVGATLETIGGTLPDPAKQYVGDTRIRLLPFAVSVVTLKE
jgi:hypothetical protein